jgi:predicted phage terminase large subunit-like protein
MKCRRLGLGVVGLVLMAAHSVAAATGVGDPARVKLLERVRALTMERQARDSEQSLHRYMRYAWSHVDPAKFVDNWHLGNTCEVLQACEMGQIQKAAFTMPPGHAKSMTIGVMLPSWLWGPRNTPARSFLNTSYAIDNPIRDAGRARRLMQDDWYQKLWGDRFGFTSDQNVKSFYQNDRGGFRLSGSFKRGTTGKRADWLIVDDPTDLADAVNVKALESSIHTYDTVLSSRLNDPQTGVRLLVMQRVNQGDLVGHVLKEQGWYIVSFSTAFEPDKRCRVFLEGRLLVEDPRTKAGELLWPTRYSAEYLYGTDPKTGQVCDPKAPARGSLKHRLGTFAWQSQQQQDPIGAEGNLVKRGWFRFYTTPDQPVFNGDGSPVPTIHVDDLTEQMLSLDCSFKDLDTSDPVSLGVWGKRGPDAVLVHRVNDRLDTPATIKLVETVTARYPKALTKVIEEAANGYAVIQTLKTKIPGLIAVPPARLGNLDTRLAGCSPMIEAGNCWLPHPEIAPWIEDFLAEVCGYPKWGHDDDVSMLTLALLRYTVHTSNVFELWKQQAAEAAAKAAAANGEPEATA